MRMVYRDDAASLKWLASPAEDGNGTSNEVFVIAIPLDSFTQPAMELHHHRGSSVVVGFPCRGIVRGPCSRAATW